MQCSKFSLSYIDQNIILPSLVPIPPLSILYAQRPLGAGNLALLAGDPAGSHLDSHRQRFEGALGAVVVVEAAQAVDVQRDAGGLGEALEAVRDHLAAQVANLLALQAELDDSEGPVRQVDHGPRQRLVQRRVRRAEPRQPRRRAQRLRERVPQGDADVFGGVVVVDCWRKGSRY